MYETLLWLHSWLRWAALIAAVVAAIVGWRGAFAGGAWTTGARKASLFFVIAMDLQLVLGMLLYATSPFTQAAMDDMGAAMKDPQLRFWAVEHVSLMVIALVVAHVGNVMVKKAPTDQRKYRRLAWAATIVLVLMVAVIPWPGRAAGRPLFR